MEEGAKGLLCSADLTTTGTFEPTNGTGIDPAEGGCIPLGKWTVDVTVASKGNCQDVLIKNQYVYTVTEDPEAIRDRWVTVYDQDPNATLSSLSFNIEGPCNGIFIHYSADGKQMATLRPTTNPEAGSLTISGTGTFELYSESQLTTGGL